MARSTGSANSVNDLLAKIAVFAGEIGWTVDRNTAGVLCLHQPPAFGGYFSFVARTDAQGMRFYCNTGYAAGNAPDSQPGSSRTNSSLDGTVTEMLIQSSGPYSKYYFFGTTQYIHVVLEIQSGTFAHLQMGTLDKKGVTYVGGQYCTANYWPVVHSRTDATTYTTGNWDGKDSYQTGALWTADSRNLMVRVDTFDEAPSPWWTKQVCGVGKGDTSQHWDAPMVYASNNEFTSRQIVVPCRPFKLPTSSNVRGRLLGEVKDFGVVDMTRLNAGDIITYGQDEWQVFPAYRLGTTGIHDSRNTGYAFLIRS